MTLPNFDSFVSCTESFHFSRKVSFVAQFFSLVIPLVMTSTQWVTGLTWRDQLGHYSSSLLSPEMRNRGSLGRSARIPPATPRSRPYNPWLFNAIFWLRNLQINIHQCLHQHGGVHSRRDRLAPLRIIDPPYPSLETALCCGFIRRVLGPSSKQVCDDVVYAGYGTLAPT